MFGKLAAIWSSYLSAPLTPTLSPPKMGGEGENRRDLTATPVFFLSPNGGEGQVEGGKLEHFPRKSQTGTNQSLRINQIKIFRSINPGEIDRETTGNPPGRRARDRW